MLLIKYTFFPGWTYGDDTSWDSEISEEGMVKQYLNPREWKTKRKHGIDIRKRQLSDDELLNLFEILENFDIAIVEYFRKLPFRMEDTEEVGLFSALHSIEISAPLITLEHLSLNNHICINRKMLAGAYKLWAMVDKLQPYSWHHKNT